MPRPTATCLLCTATLALFLACATDPRTDRITVIHPGPEAQKKAQTAMIQAQPGDVVEFAAGRFNFDSTLSLDVEGVTIRGQGMDQTILDFSEQVAGSGGEGLSITAGGFTLTELAVANTRSDAVKVHGVSDVVFRAVRVEWEGGPRTENGAYGLYPVQCRNVLIEDSKVRGASDAGIYVGQSENVIVRRNQAWENVAGIEIENTVGADVYDNESWNNTGGILVFSLPELPKKNGRLTRVFNNLVHDNNHPNFALEGNIVANVPPGVGLMLMASDQTEIFDNRLAHNQTVNLSVVSYFTTERPYEDPDYDPFTEGVYIHDNTFEGGGNQPSGKIAEAVAPHFGGRLPDIVYDGMIDPAKLEGDALPAELGIYIENNGDADFVNFHLASLLEGEVRMETELAAYAGKLPALPAPVSLDESTHGPSTPGL